MIEMIFVCYCSPRQTNRSKRAVSELSWQERDFVISLELHNLEAERNIRESRQ
jgi:hypothetical protein